MADYPNGSKMSTVNLVGSIVALLVSIETKATDRTRQVETDGAAARTAMESRMTDRLNLIDSRLSDQITAEQVRNNDIQSRLAGVERVNQLYMAGKLNLATNGGK